VAVATASDHVGAAGGHPTIVISDVDAYLAGPAVYYRPPSLIVGVGSARGVSAREVGMLIDEALAAESLHSMSVRCVATVDLKADEEGILAAARERGWEVVTYPADVLSGVEVPNPSEVVWAEVGTPASPRRPRCMRQVVRAERRAGRREAQVGQRHGRHRKAAAQGQARDRRAGAGARDLVTPRAITALQRASVIVGLDQYVDQIRDLLRPAPG